MTKTKFLAYTAILGFILWAISEMIEIVSGYVPIGYYLTSIFHFLAAFGMWSLHLLQTKKKNTLSLVGTAIISIVYFSIIYFPIQVMNSGLSVSEFFKQHLVYQVSGFAFMVGHIIFGIAVLKTKYFPSWTAFIVILGSIIVTAIYGYEMFTVSVPMNLQIVMNVNNIIFSAAIIYMCFFGLKRISTAS